MTRKFLLLADIPPNKGMTGGLFLNDMVRLIPQGSLAIMATVHPFLGDYTLSPDVGDAPFKHVDVPYARSRVRTLRKRLGGAVGSASSLMVETLINNYHLPRLVEQAVDFGREVGTEAVWTLLQSPLMWRIARRVATTLDVPLYTFIMDPPDWWMEFNQFDPYWRRRLIHEFEASIRHSEAIGCGSWNMATEYEAAYGTRAVPIVPSLPRETALAPAEAPHDRDTFVIGMAGQLYAKDEWHSLLRALASVNWHIAGRRIIIRLMGSVDLMSPKYMPRVPVNIEFRGWRDQPTTIDLLADADACYCPYRFGEIHRTEARLAFPGKLTTYLTTGRPVFFHGPDYASPAQFLHKHDAGACCHSTREDDLVHSLEVLITDGERYAQIARNGVRAFKAELTLETQRQRVAEFIGVNVDDLRHPKDFNGLPQSAV